MQPLSPEQLAGRAAASRRWRAANASRLREERAAASAARRAEVATLKESNPCTDCGGFFLAVSMDYDHVAADKDRDVSKLVHYASMTQILAEIAKCELVCANCHRVRTAARKLTFNPERDTPVSQTS